MAKRRVKGRGRPIVALLLVGFVLVATGVIWRRSFGIAQSRELRELDKQRLELEAQKARLQGEIRDLSSRAKLAPIAEQRLNMHVPNDSQVIILPRPSASSSPSRSTSDAP
jgi:cell division protein FtsL